MAAGENMIQAGFTGAAQSAGGRKLILILGVAAVVAVMAGVWMWGKQPSYRILFSNFNDRDGGAIVAALEKMNVPYKYAEGGGAILVPEDMVHDARLKLAAQGLPKGGNVGFELMENQKLGVSQFVEQVNFQRALEGELARSIEAVSAVQAARVHLALPKASVFVRDQQKPTASVLLNLHPGRALDQQQVSAILHLVASSVPELSAKQVTIIDQNGSLLSENGNALTANGLDPGQIKYVQELQQGIARQIESILTPIVGHGNVRAEVTADVDFSRSEQAVESYKPNQTPENMAIRSQQTMESQNGAAGAAGVPGALSNQPPAPSTAPIDAAGAQAAPGAAPAAAGVNLRKDATVNYELDKSIQYVQQGIGGLKRLSVAVVVNYKKTTDADGKPGMQPLTDAEKTQITDLVKEAMGYNGERGDSLNVVNSRFVEPEQQIIPQPPVWKQPSSIQMAKNAGQFLIMAALLLYLYLKLLKPLLRSLSASLKASPLASLPQPQAIEGEMMTPGARGYQDNLARAKQLATQDPRAVAGVVKGWVGSNE